MNYRLQIAQDGNLLRRSAPQKKPKKPLRRVSKKRERENREYAKRRKRYLAEHPFCEAHPTILMWAYEFDNELFRGMPLVRPASIEIHHTRKPKCKYLNDESTWLAVCRWSHDWIENHKDIARELCLLH